MSLSTGRYFLLWRRHFDKINRHPALTVRSILPRKYFLSRGEKPCTGVQKCVDDDNLYVCDGVLARSRGLLEALRAPL